MNEERALTELATRVGAGETLYRQLIEQMPAVVYIETNDEHPRLLYIGPQVGDVLGRPAEDWLANPKLWDESIHPEDRRRVHERWFAAVRAGTSFVEDYRVVRHDGRLVWIHDSCVPIHDESGTTIYWHGMALDVTASKTTEETLRASEARYRALIENVPAVVYIVAPDDDRKTLYVSPQVEVALGYSRQEWLEQPDIWMELLHPDDREETLAAHDLHNETGRPWSREYRLIASDGRPVWFRDVATLVRDANGQAMHWQGVQLDITERKLAEERLQAAHDELEFRVLERTHELEVANELMQLEIEERRRVERELREAQDRYRLLTEHLPGAAYVWSIGRDQSIYVSPQVESILGFTSDEWRPPNFWVTRIHPDDRQSVLAATLRSSFTGEPFAMEYRYLAKDGHVVWVLDQAILHERDERGQPAIFHGLMLDITDRKEAEARSFDNELRYRTLAGQIPAITYLWTPTTTTVHGGNTRYISEQVQTVLGFSPSEWMAKPDFWIGRLHPEDRERVLESASRVLPTGEPFSLQYRMIAADGSTVWVRDEGRAVAFDERGRPTEWQGIMLDVSEHERARQAQRTAELRFRALVEHIPAIVFIELPGLPAGESKFLYLSPQIEAVVGYTAEELMADPAHFERMLHPDDRHRIVAANERSEKTGLPFDEEYRVIAKDGRVVWFHSRSSLVQDDSAEPVWQGVAFDVTDQHRDSDGLGASSGSGAAPTDRATV